MPCSEVLSRLNSVNTTQNPMTGTIAQLVALTCYGNAFLAGVDIPHFFPENSTCQFCDSIKFVELSKSSLGKITEATTAGSPDEWIEQIKKHGALGIRLLREPQNKAGVTDRMSAGFVGGGGSWMMEVLLPNNRSMLWAPRWEVWNQNAPQNKIWRVTYGLVAEIETKSFPTRALQAVKVDFQAGLEKIRAFSQQEKCDGFTKCFDSALKALAEPEADIGYHKDLFVAHSLSADGASLLKGAMGAWVFGGMGSWNDMGFDGERQKEYEQVSERLFSIVNEAISTAATSSIPLPKKDR
jgi:hypothetical protein